MSTNNNMNNDGSDDRSKLSYVYDDEGTPPRSKTQKKAPRGSKIGAAIASAKMRASQKGAEVKGQENRHFKQQLADSFWGQAWCRYLQNYKDHEHRLARGRSLLRAGAVSEVFIAVDGVVTAQVFAEELFEQKIMISRISEEKWCALVRDISGKISAAQDLFAGRFSDEVMALIVDEETGIFPAVSELKTLCNCLDTARLCEHSAAVLYALGAQFGSDPSLMFTLRGVSHEDLISSLGGEMVKNLDESLSGEDLTRLEDIFGIDIDGDS